MSRFVALENYHLVIADLRLPLLTIFIEGGYSGSIYLFIKMDLVYHYKKLVTSLSTYPPRIVHPLRKHAYSNILKILPPKNENLQKKKFWYSSYFC